jgi:hypothetical protein
VQKLAASPHRAATGRSATCLKSAEPDPSPHCPGGTAPA